MKRSLFRSLKPVALTGTGVFLGRGACADTTLTFDARPSGQGQNAAILQSFGDNVVGPSPGVSVVGNGTPDIGLTWRATPSPNNVDTTTRWDYYIDSVWSAGQLNSSHVGDFHELVFTPTSTTSVVLKSFNFHPYYNSTERFTYEWSVLGGANVLTNGNITFLSDGTKNHPVEIFHSGSQGQELVLRLTRLDSTLNGDEIEGGAGNIAVDDITFAQFPEPTGLTLLTSSPRANETGVPPEVLFTATIKDGSVRLATNSVQLALNGNAVALSSLTRQTNLTLLSYQASGLLAAGTNRYRLVYTDDAAAPKSYTNDIPFVVPSYTNLSLQSPIVFENFDSTPEGSLPSGWTQTNYTDTSLSDTNVDFGNLDSAAFATWTVVDVARFRGSFISYSNTNAPPTTDYQRVLSVNPVNVVNGQFVRDLATGRMAFGNSGYRNGRSQVMYLFSPDFDLSGKTNVYLSFHSLWEQNQDSIGAVEYSINQGQAWLPVIYLLDGPDVLRDANNNVDPVATFTTEGQSAAQAIAFYTDPADGLDKGGTYGAFIGVDQNQWPELAPYISARVDDDPIESKRVELFRLPQADNQPKVRFRFAHAGTDSWYFGIDDFGLYSIGASATRPSVSARLSVNALTISWPQDVLGYLLESTDSLTNPNWNSVSGVTNNSVTVAVGPGIQFYRLRQ